MGERKKKNNYISYSGSKMAAMAVLFLLLLIKISFMTKRIGAAGISYFALAFSIFFFLFCLNGSMIPDILRKMILFQVNRRSVKNAIRLYRIISNFSMCIALLFGLILFFLSDQISRILFQTVLASLPIKLFALVLVMLVPQQCMKGYLEGISSQIPGIVSMFILAVIDLATTIIIQNSCIEYGQKVAAVMLDQRYYYAYACVSGIIGLAVGSVFSLLFLLLITALLRQMQRERMKQDESKNTLAMTDILGSFLSGSVQSLFPNCFIAALFLCSCILFGHKKPEQMDGIGMLFISLLTGMPILLNGAFQGRFAFRQIHSIVRKGDMIHARERMAVQLKTLLCVTLFLSVLLMFSSVSFNALVFDTTTDEMLSVFRGTQLAILVLTLAVMILYITAAFTGFGLQFALYLAGVAVFPLMTTLFRGSGMQEIMVCVYALLVSGLVPLLFGGFVCFKKSRYREDIIRVFVLPCIAAAALLLVCLLVEKLFYKSIGAAAAFGVSFVIGYLCYMLVLILTRTFDRHEWSELPFSGAAIFLAKKLHMY